MGDLVSFVVVVVVVVVSLKTETSGAGDHTQINYKISLQPSLWTLYLTFSLDPVPHTPRPCN